jgi:hypothetical protein
MPTIPDCYYFRSIDRRWRKELRKARLRVLVLSPYVTSPIAQLVLKCASPKICQIYTTFCDDTFASGASSLKTLKKLMQGGYSIYSLEGLHAKVVIVDHTFASIGSQNLTTMGASNLEATVAITNAGDIAAIADRIHPWLDKATLITGHMLADAEDRVRKLEKRLKASRREAWAQRYHAAVINHFGNGNISKEMAMECIRRSAVWFRRDTEWPAVLIPGEARRVTGSDGDWRLKLGGNVLHISWALQRCLATIESCASDLISGKPWSKEELRKRLRSDVCRSVTNRKGHEYSNYPLREGRDLVFGNHGIDVNWFTSVLLESLPLDDMPS